MDADDLARGRELAAGLESPLPWHIECGNLVYDSETRPVVGIDLDDNPSFLMGDAAAVVWAINNLAALLDAAARATRYEAALQEIRLRTVFRSDSRSRDIAGIADAALERPEGDGDGA